jgi:hypothetical protein
MAEAVNARLPEHLYYRRLSTIESLGVGGFVVPPNGFERVTLSAQFLKMRVKFLLNFKTVAFLL